MWEKGVEAWGKLAESKGSYTVGRGKRLKVLGERREKQERDIVGEQY